MGRDSFEHSSASWRLLWRRAWLRPAWSVSSPARACSWASSVPPRHSSHCPSSSPASRRRTNWCEVSRSARSSDIHRGAAARLGRPEADRTEALVTALSARTVGELDPRVGRPAYDRSKVTAGIVHFGVGGFHRAHEAMYLDRLLELGQAFDWGICGVGALPQDRRIIDTLSSQDGLYTVVVKHPDGHRDARVI